MLFNSTFCLQPCSAQEQRNARADPTSLKISETFSSCSDFFVVAVVFHWVSVG